MGGAVSGGPDDALRELFSLRGQHCLVTGASSGIGAASASALAAAGADVTLWGRTAESLQSAVVACSRYGNRVTTVLADLNDPEAAAATAAELADRVQIDVLVNSAGVISREPAVDTSFSAWRQVLAVNLDSIFCLSQAIGRGMVERGQGAIISIASLLSFQGGVNVVGYTASKHGVLGITRALSNEWAGHGVRVNAIAPGYVATTNTAPLRADAERETAIRERIPLGRWATPSDIAGAVVFLAGPAARYITGEVLTVDGGWMAR